MGRIPRGDASDVADAIAIRPLGVHPNQPLQCSPAASLEGFGTPLGREYLEEMLEDPVEFHVELVEVLTEKAEELLLDVRSQLQFGPRDVEASRVVSLRSTERSKERSVALPRKEPEALRVVDREVPDDSGQVLQERDLWRVPGSRGAPVRVDEAFQKGDPSVRQGVLEQLECPILQSLRRPSRIESVLDRSELPEMQDDQPPDVVSEGLLKAVREVLSPTVDRDLGKEIGIGFWVRSVRPLRKHPLDSSQLNTFCIPLPGSFACC